LNNPPPHDMSFPEKPAIHINMKYKPTKIMILSMSCIQCLPGFIISLRRFFTAPRARDNRVATGVLTDSCKIGQYYQEIIVCF
ncbi:hypothetical protein, partial [Escherichia coli]|uniref:hypothetical protein n=4 Tax=Escherichia coli TaxID=562 RepID=UPI000E36DFE3